jgi:hypothetical protein
MTYFPNNLLEDHVPNIMLHKGKLKSSAEVGITGTSTDSWKKALFELRIPPPLQKKSYVNNDDVHAKFLDNDQRNSPSKEPSQQSKSRARILFGWPRIPGFREVA